MERATLEELLETTRGRYLTFGPSRRVRNRRLGDHRSALVGDEGTEFAGLREAGPYDSLRRLHPRATAQFGRPMLRQFTPPREAGVLVLMDLQRSMYLREKMHVAFCAAALLARFALHVHMPFGIWTCGSEYDIGLRQKTGNVQFQRATNLLMDVISGDVDDSEAHRHHLSQPLDGLRSFLSQGSLLFVISDFLNLDDNNLIPTVLSKTEGFDAIAVIVQDELEYSFPVSIFGKWGKEVPFHDVGNPKQSGGFWMSAQTARERREVHEARFEKLLRRFRDMGFLYSHLSTPDAALIFEKLQAAL